VEVEDSEDAARRLIAAGVTDTGLQVYLMSPGANPVRK